MTWRGCRDDITDIADAADIADIADIADVADVADIAGIADIAVIADIADIADIPSIADGERCGQTLEGHRDAIKCLCVSATRLVRSLSAAHRDKSRDWNVSKQTWNLC